MLTRSSLETQKLELMSTISELKLQHAALERENLELRTAAQINNNSLLHDVKKSVYLSRVSPQSTHTSTPVHASNPVSNYILIYVYKFYSCCKITAITQITIAKSCERNSISSTGRVDAADVKRPITQSKYLFNNILIYLRETSN